jgi:hypothetical protein
MQTPHRTGRPLVLYSLSRPHRNSHSTKRCLKCCSYSYSFVVVIAAGSASATRPTHPAEICIYEKLRRRLILCAITLLLLLHIHPNSTMRLLTIFSPKHSQTSKSIVDAPSTTRTRSSTAITTLEKELGMCEPPKSGEQLFYPLSHSGTY